MTRLVGDLLDSARIEAGALPLSKAPQDVFAVARERGERREREILFAVTDQGEGIEESHLPHLFER